MSPGFQRVRFRHLMLVEALATTKSLRQAALLLGTTQPGSSKLLRELEDELGAVLFDRTARGVTPTPYGDALIRASHLMLAQADATLDEIAAISTGAHARVKVGIFGVALASFVAGVVDEVASRSPGLLVALEEGTGDSLLSALGRGDIDAVIGRGSQPRHADAFTQIPLFHEPVVLVGRWNHPLARRKRITLQEVASLEWILPSPATLLRARLEALFAAHGLPLPHCRIESSVYLANQQLLPRGDLVCVFPRTLAAALAATRSLATLALDLKLDLPPVTLWLRESASPLAPALEHFGSATRRAAEAWRDKTG